MPLTTCFIRAIEDVVEPAVAFLSRNVDIFTRQRIVVPTAGAKAWLAAELAHRLGATRSIDGSSHGDGIVANVEFSYPGTISRLLKPEGPPEIDPWDVENLTFSILKVIAHDPAYAHVVRRAGGPLLAARRIADRFDHYHFRRPGMIRRWEEGDAGLSPEADEKGHTVARPLHSNDRWQFYLWRKVREVVGSLSPPAREREAEGPGPDAVLVAGLQGLSLHQIELLQRLSEMPSASGKPCDVQVVLVHPSPTLRMVWAGMDPPASLGVAPARRESEQIEDTADPLVGAWLRGTREAQWLLASQGTRPVHADTQLPEEQPATTSLLGRLQRTVFNGGIPGNGGSPAGFDPADNSVRIHRCHDLGRQAEVLHDAILHAFREMDGLAPHEVVIVSPRIAELAPHLEATFARTIESNGGELSMPLLVADRGIHEVSQGAELLAALLELVGSRCSVDGMLAVAAHPLVLGYLGLDDDAVDIWQHSIQRTKIRWGLDAVRRGRAGLEQPDLAAHTWRLGLERMLLGAIVPDGDPVAVLGQVVPLDHVDAADLVAISPLVAIFGIIDDLDRAVAEPRTVGEWCDLLEQTLGRLAGEEHEELVVPLREIDALRQAAVLSQHDMSQSIAVPYHDVKTILAATLTAAVGQQPLRTGAITATSMIPLRGVPFRVVCVAGVDDGAVSPRENDSEDLVARQQLLGDIDSRLEVRRGLLDCLLAAGERLIVTCTGMDVKNNATLPLVTPLAELVDFVGRHGVPLAEPDEHSQIEVFHPRHACSRRNFEKSGVVYGGVAWSHDASAMAAAGALKQERKRPSRAVAEVKLPTHIEINDLAEFMHDTLWPYVRKTLEINPWLDDEAAIPATLPFELTNLERRRLRDDYIERLIKTGDRTGLAASWAQAVTANGDVPVLGFGDDTISEITLFVESLLAVAGDENVPLDQGESEPIRLEIDGVTLSGNLERWYPGERAIVFVRPDAKSSQSDQFKRVKMRAVAHLLAARGAGHGVTRAIILNQHPDWFPGAVRSNGKVLPPAQSRTIKLDEAIDQASASDLLAKLAGLYQQATARPYGLCGKTSEALCDGPEAAREEFGTFTSAAGYANTNEAVVYGMQPEFEEIFTDEAGVAAFFERFHALTHINRQYVYQPR